MYLPRRPLSTTLCQGSRYFYRSPDGQDLAERVRSDSQAEGEARTCQMQIGRLAPTDRRRAVWKKGASNLNRCGLGTCLQAKLLMQSSRRMWLPRRQFRVFARLGKKNRNRAVKGSGGQLGIEEFTRLVLEERATLLLTAWTEIITRPALDEKPLSTAHHSPMDYIMRFRSMYETILASKAGRVRDSTIPAAGRILRNAAVAISPAA